MAPPDIIDLGKSFLIAAENDGLVIDSAFIFGSYAKGKGTPESDIDIAIISPTLTESSLQNRLKLFRVRDKNALDTRIEPVGFRPERFQDWHPLVSEIRATGVKIK